MGKQIKSFSQKLQTFLNKHYENDHWIVPIKVRISMCIGDPRWPPQCEKNVLRIYLSETIGIFKRKLGLNILWVVVNKCVRFPMGFTYDFYANRWRMCSISYYFRNSSASINNVTNVNYDIDLQKMYMYSCKMPQMLCLTRWG